MDSNRLDTEPRAKRPRVTQESSSLKIAARLGCVACIFTAFTIAACSDTDGGNGGNNTDGSGAGSSLDLSDGGLGGSSSGSGGSASGNNSNANGCEPLSLEEGCAGELFAGEDIPLDIYVMFDQSGTMGKKIDETTGETRLDAVRKATEQFLTDPESAGIRVGIGYFGYQEIGHASCDPGDYDDAAVGMDLLPDHADTIMGSLNSIEPTGETPTGPAIRGACSFAGAWKQQNPGHHVVILLVTDGVPEAYVTSMSGGCDPTLEDAIAAAKSCLDDSKIPTYVLGVGPSLDNLNQIAEAGGSDQAYLVEKDSSEGVLAALNAVRGAARIPCEIELSEPDSGQSLNYEQTDLVWMDSDCQVSRVSKVESAAACDPSSGGWHFDDPDAPSRIVLCESSCSDVKAPRTEMYYSIGCNIDVVIR